MAGTLLAHDPFSRPVLIVIGSFALSIGGFFLVLWIAVSAITWSISHTPGR